MADHSQRPMPLILAIEPNRRQASALSATVRAHLRAELIVAESAGPALAALGDRVPDLILLSALLPARDEAAVAERLRVDPAAAHVQTLTIPWLATPEPPLAMGRGVLSALIGDRSSEEEQGGCDPAIFAEQCAAYLERAVSEREQRGLIASMGRADAADKAVVAVAKTDPPTQPAPMEQWPEADPLVAAAVASFETRASTASFETPAPTDDCAGFDFSATLDEGVFQQLSNAIETVTRDSVAPQAPTTPSVDAWTERSLASAAVWPAMDFAPAEKPRSNPAEKPRGKSPSAASPTANKFPVHRPLQDEWGLFDPDQCGFAALLENLQEITQVASSLPAAKPPAGSRSVNR